MDPQRLLGAWRLDAFVVETVGGSRVQPYGPDARGLLVYTPQGWVSATLCAADRGSFGATRFEDARTAVDADKIRAFDGYTSYAGRYRIEGDVVVHEIEMSLVPTMVGQTVRRNARFEGPSLVLSYDVRGAKGTHHYTLRWTRP